MNAIERLLQTVGRIEVGMESFRQARWPIYDAETGRMVCIDGPNVSFQKVVWSTNGWHFERIDLYLN